MTEWIPSRRPPFEKRTGTTHPIDHSNFVQNNKYKCFGFLRRAASYSNIMGTLHVYPFWVEAEYSLFGPDLFDIGICVAPMPASQPITFPFFAHIIQWLGWLYHINYTAEFIIGVNVLNSMERAREHLKGDDKDKF